MKGFKRSSRLRLLLNVCKKGRPIALWVHEAEDNAVKLIFDGHELLLLLVLLLLLLLELLVLVVMVLLLLLLLHGMLLLLGHYRFV